MDLPDPVEEEAPPVPEQDDALVDTVLDVFVQRMVGQGPAAHQVWLPPLEEAPSMDHLLPPLQLVAERGLTAPGYPVGRLRAPIGIVDKPREQKTDILEVDYAGAAGHGLVVGGPRSGKSTVVRTMVASFALTHTPLEVQFYLLDFGAGSFQSLAGLPHVGGVAGRLDVDRVRRMVSEVHGVMNRREELFRVAGIDTIATYRARRAAGQLPDEAFGDVFLVIDGWNTFKQEFEGLEPVIGDIAQRGLGYGVHLVVTAARYAEVRPALKDLLQNRTELKLGDAMESEVDRRVAVNVPSLAGRGITPDRLHFLSGLPRLDGSSSVDDLQAGVSGLVTAVAGPGAARAPRRCECCRPSWTGTRCRRASSTRSAAWPSAWTRRSCRRSSSTSRPTRCSSSSATPSRGSRPCCGCWSSRSPSGTPRTRRASWSATTGARCWARCRRSTWSSTRPRSRPCRPWWTCCAGPAPAVCRART